MLRIVLPTCLVLAALLQPAAADTLNKTLSGKRLALQVSCPADIEIQPGATLTGQIEIEASAEDRAALDALHFTDGETARIERRGDCGLIDLGDNDVTLTIRVPLGTPIDIGGSSAGRYEIGEIGGALTASLSGAAELHAARLTELELDSAGTAEIRIDRLDGPGTVALHGGGELAISAGTMPSLRLEASGAGDIRVDGDEIGALDVALAGAGDAEIHATVRDATLEITGIGSIAVDKVTGKADRKILGLGDIEIGS